MHTNTFIADQRSGSVELPAIPHVAARDQLAYSMENPIYPLTDPSIFSEGLVATSGHRVSPIKSLHLPAVYQAVTRIAGDIARCPLELYVEKDGICKALLDDPIHRLTAIQPNREMDAFKFWNRVVTQRLVWQNAYIFIAPNAAGDPVELLPLLADRTHPKRAGGKLFYITETSDGEIPIPANRIIHLEGITFDNMEAMELTKLMRDAWGLALAQMDFASRVYRTGGRKGGWLEIPLGMTKTATDKLEEGFRRKYEDPSAAFTTVILRDNAKFHEGQMTLRESQVLEGREESVRDVARAFNIRPGHLGVETTGVYGNKADDTRDYVDNTLRPHMAGIAAQCRVKLLTLDRQGSHCFGHNTDELERLSLQEEFTAYGAGVTARIITPNEARGKLGFPPLPDGDTLQNPNTQAAPPPGEDPGTPPPKKKPKPKSTDELNAAHRELLDRTIAGVVAVIGEKGGRAAASGAKFCTWLDEKLPAERETLRRAIAPVASCIAAAGGGDAAQLTTDIVSRTHKKLRDELNAIATGKTEAELKPAITEYFQNWSNEPCPDSAKAAA